MKEFIIGGVVVVLGLLVGVTWQNIPDKPLLAILPLLFTISWASAAILVANSARRYGITILSIAVLAVFLGRGGWTLVGGLLGSLIAAFAVWSVNRQHRAVFAFSFRYVLRQGLGAFFTALALLFSFSYYGAIAGKPVDTASILPRNIFDIALRVAEGALQKQFPGFRNESTVDETLALIIQQQLTQNPNMNPANIPSIETIKKELPMQRKEIIKNLNRDLGLSIDPDISGDEKIGNVLYELSTARAEPYLEPYSALLPSLMAIAFFFALKTASMAYYYITLLLMPALFWLLQMSGIIEKKTVSAEKEVFKLINSE